MSSREFTDDRGEVWQVWAVLPESLERRIADDPNLAPPVERRVKRESRVKVSNPLMAGGWLAFENRTERRRFAPIPADWSAMEETELRSLLSQAASVGSTQRLLD